LIDGAVVVTSLKDLIEGAKTKVIQVNPIPMGRVDDTGTSMFNVCRHSARHQ
jgi:hypothetical protein